MMSVPSVMIEEWMPYTCRENSYIEKTQNLKTEFTYIENNRILVFIGRLYTEWLMCQGLALDK